MRSAILLIIYKRESTTKRVFEAIRQAQPPRLYIAANAPNPEKEDDQTKCALTRQCTENVDWPCEVKRWYREKHLSAGISISSAISWFFENEEQGVILEDDILPDQDFFLYCDELLDYYKNDKNIQLISGYNFFLDGYSAPYSYYMSHFLQIWGWASWRRVWKTYEYETNKLDRNDFLEKLRKNFSRPIYRYYKDVFDLMSKQKNDTWDYQFFFNQVLYGRSSIIPYINLVENIGFGSVEASHSTDTDNSFINKLINHKSHSIMPLRHPSSFYEDKTADNLYAQLAQYEKPTLLYRGVRKLLSYIKRK